ncbi:flagellar basal body rod protein FlgC [Halothiobacillus neapolitanus]|jgi:flagellar basal-body rod protein FlgC|uniref:Flagellar basal-body rod protein FlgC n=1 Tax=Halothiobacillus neapolitanus (strain ATCC 23641 / DSM 15147 / CIP 104769 / NCIMB 8539 / c2) TaxID=555778 RepID=D0L1M5_HALNC|nr:flagellar basal-body rod protein FlgC [Halothiobacillus neapolitanus c2]OZB75914.1 MAG: flagellar basal body rod protein FlgC [Halothiobacillus sp. 14-55-98]TDN65292.1 flagellar basal-body rod protein FlgC [Halothiobacillus neapolitanus]
MSLFSIFNVSSSAMSAQSLRLNATASNMANADAVATKPEDAYKAREPVFQQVMEQNGGVGVRVSGITQSTAPNPALYEPGNPLANKDGYVYSSNVNPVEEMVNMLSASRSYQTNVQMMDTAKNLALRTLQLGQ